MSQGLCSAVALTFLTLSASYGQESKLLSESGPVFFDHGSVVSRVTSLPRFTGGVLLLEHHNGPADTLYSTYFRDGKLAARFRIDIPDARETIGGRIAPLRGGAGYVAVAIAMNGSQRAATLCYLDGSGKLDKVVRTSPLWPYDITIASDGTLWGFGASSSNDDPASDDPVLFHYSSSGQLLGTALPRKLFGREPPYELSTDLGVPVVTSGGNRVVVYSPHTHQLFELALDGAVTGSYTIPVPEYQGAAQTAPRPMFFSALAVTEKGVIYARLQGGEGTGIYELDRAHQKWVPLPPELMGKVRAYSLIGAEQEELALTPAGPRGSGFPVEWIHLTPRFLP